MIHVYLYELQHQLLDWTILIFSISSKVSWFCPFWLKKFLNISFNCVYFHRLNLIIKILLKCLGLMEVNSSGYFVVYLSYNGTWTLAVLHYTFAFDRSMTFVIVNKKKWCTDFVLISIKVLLNSKCILSSDWFSCDNCMKITGLFFLFVYFYAFLYCNARLLDYPSSLNPGWIFKFLPHLPSDPADRICPLGLLASSSYGTSSHIKANGLLCSYAQCYCKLISAAVRCSYCAWTT